MYIYTFKKQLIHIFTISGALLSYYLVSSSFGLKVCLIVFLVEKINKFFQIFSIRDTCILSSFPRIISLDIKFSVETVFFQHFEYAIQLSFDLTFLMRNYFLILVFPAYNASFYSCRLLFVF